MNTPNNDPSQSRPARASGTGSSAAKPATSIALSPEIIILLVRINKNLAKLRGLTERTDDLRSTVRSDFEKVLKIFGIQPLIAGQFAPLEINPEAELARRKQAEDGLRTIKVVELPDGSARVRLDGGTEVRLIASVYRLLKALLREPFASDSRDGLVAWKSVDLIAKELSSSGGNLPSESNIRMLVRRLRQKLGNPHLIAGIRGKGYRLALQKSAMITIVAHDSHNPDFPPLAA